MPAEQAPGAAAGIHRIEIVDGAGQTLPGFMQREREQALRGLTAESRFQPRNDNSGPYAVTLAVEESRLVVRIRNAHGHDLQILALSLRPYQRLIQDYFLMIESYEKARQTATREKLEAIDMGRRGIHNEGADLLIVRLRDKIDIDHETARRLFTLICTLHQGNMRLAV